MTAIEDLKNQVKNIDRHDFKGRLDLLNQMIELEPKNTTYLHEKAFLLITMERENEAISTYDKIIEISGHDFAAYFRKGEILRAFGHEKEAEICFHKASNPDEK